MKDHAETDLPSPVELTDEQGQIPRFPPRVLDTNGKLIPLSPEERRARTSAALQALEAIRDSEDDDPADTAKRVMQGIDSQRAAGQKLFEGLY